ncbi:Scr1 family TA system antitoxin-like transcriptional regulator [Streptosporangium sp. CA-135522]
MAAPHIEVRVLPFSAGAHAGPTGAFRILQMKDPYSAELISAIAEEVR